MSITEKETKIDCTQCEHYFVTWQKEHPHGCRFFGFKSANSPALAVIENSGERCHAFLSKKQPPIQSPKNSKSGGWIA